MKWNLNKYCFGLLLILLLAGSNSLWAQSVRSLYFIDNAPARLNLNPALQPMRGYLNLPVVGGFDISAVSDPLSVNDFKDILSQKNGFLENDVLMGKLKKDNRLNLGISADLLALGFYIGKGFCTMNISTRIMLNASIPKTLFEFARHSNDLQKLINEPDLSVLDEWERLKNGYEVEGLQIGADAFVELGVGYSRPVDERLTVGGRLKILIGLGNIDAHIDEMSIRVNNPAPQSPSDLQNLSWRVKAQGNLKASVKGLGLTEEDGYISDIDLGSPGVGGFGLGIDLGAVYAVFPGLAVSAAVTDLGFIRWSDAATTSAIVNESHDYNVGEEGTQVLDFDLLRFEKEKTAAGRTSSLRSNLNLGIEYSLLEKQLGFGLLSTTRFQKGGAFSELTASANYHPRNWLGATLSYSFLHSDFKTFGLGVKLGPLFLATDYMVTGNLDSISRVNAYLGFCIPLGPKKKTN